MEQTQPPIRVVVPGKCYRFEATDPTHEWMMTQVEGLAVDEGISMADLKGTLAEFAHRIFGRERKVAFKCDYFPFVDPAWSASTASSGAGAAGRAGDPAGSRFWARHGAPGLTNGRYDPERSPASRSAWAWSAWPC
jgi:hypothetical protein